TGSVVPGTSAQFTPLTKKANTSLNSLFAKSLYSSDENTYLNSMLENCGTKSNSSAAASNVSKPDRTVRLLSPGAPTSVLLAVPDTSLQLLGPSTPPSHNGSLEPTVWTLPVPTTIPASKPMMPAPPLTMPAARGLPVYTTFEIVTPLPMSVFARVTAVI